MSHVSNATILIIFNVVEVIDGVGEGFTTVQALISVIIHTELFQFLSLPIDFLLITIVTTTARLPFACPINQTITINTILLCHSKTR